MSARLYRNHSRQRLHLGVELGRGGEGCIYTVVDAPDQVAKLYHRPDAAIASKLAVMQAAVGDRALALPQDLVCTASGTVVGYLMPRVRDAHPLHALYTPKSRRQVSPYFNFLYLLRAARNLAAAVSAVHAAGYAIGDLNESNILVSETALVTLIDTDSFQVRDPLSGRLYPCPVGKPEFTPPELHGRDLSQVTRAPVHDRFGLAVLLFQLLMEGTHPFDGLYQGAGEPPSKAQRIAGGHFPYSRLRRGPYRPKPLAPELSSLHPRVQRLFRRCFEGGHGEPMRRPSARLWVEALDEAERLLAVCARNDQHYYSLHRARCPWCDRAAQLGDRDPFPNPQAQLPAPRPRPWRSRWATVTQPLRRWRSRRLHVTSLPPLPPRSLAAGLALVLLGAGASFGHQQWTLRRSQQAAQERVRAWQAAGEYATCLTAARALSPAAPELVAACQVGRAQQLAAAGAWPAAIALARQVEPQTAVYPQARALVRQGLRGRAPSESLAASEPDLARQAAQQAAAGEWEQAIATYTRLLQQEPANADAYLARGQLYSARGQRAIALEDYRQAAALYQQQGNGAGYERVLELLAAQP